MENKTLKIIGKVSVYKSLTLPKLTYLFSVLPNPPEQIIKLLTQESYSFIWNSKRDKVKRNTIIQNIEDGGINMIDIPIYLNSIKSSWINRIANSKIKGHEKK